MGPEIARKPPSCLFRAALICKQSLCSKYGTAVSMMVLLAYSEYFSFLENAHQDPVVLQFFLFMSDLFSVRYL